LTDLPVVVNSTTVEGLINVIALETRESHDNSSTDIGLVVETRNDGGTTGVISNGSECSDCGFTAPRVTVAAGKVAQSPECFLALAFSNGPAGAVNYEWINIFQGI
jgi:hypothetical protein